MAIAQFEVVQRNVTAGDGAIDRIHKVKPADKLKALELLGKHLKLFTDKVEVSGDLVLIDRLTSARRRLSGDGGAQ